VARIIGHQAAFAADVGIQDWRNIGNRRAVDMEAAGRAAALDQRQNDILGGLPPLAGWPAKRPM
jgi:hypothetical protein